MCFTYGSGVPAGKHLHIYKPTLTEQAINGVIKRRALLLVTKRIALPKREVQGNKNSKQE